MSQDNVELVRRVIQALNAGGVEAALSLHLYAEDVRIYPSSEWPEEEMYRGHSGFRSLYHAWTDHFDDWSWELQEIRDLGDQVVGLVEMRGRLKDSDVAICEPWGVVCSVRDGCISEVWHFRNQRQALEAVGLAQEGRSANAGRPPGADLGAAPDLGIARETRSPAA
jgi:ketosteroid isomerase-like protein